MPKHAVSVRYSRTRVVLKKQERGSQFKLQDVVLNIQTFGRPWLATSSSSLCKAKQSHPVLGSSVSALFTWAVTFLLSLDWEEIDVASTAHVI